MSTPTSTSYRRFKGYYNLADSQRIRPNDGETFLLDSMNVHQDKTKRIQMREGFDQVDTNDFRWLWDDKEGLILGVVNGNLCRLYTEGGTTWYKTVLQYSVGVARFNFKKVMNRVYGTNNSLFGYYNSSTDTWTDSLSTDKTYKRVMPAGHLIEEYRQRLYVAKDNTIIYSGPKDYEHYDIREDRNYIHKYARITMLAGITDGMWIGTENSVDFYQGNGPTDFLRKQIVNYGAVENCYSVGKNISMNGEVFADAVMMTTTKGICIGGNGGRFINLTEKNYEMGVAREGCGFLRSGNFNEYISITR